MTWGSSGSHGSSGGVVYGGGVVYSEPTVYHSPTVYADSGYSTPIYGAPVYGSPIYSEQAIPGRPVETPRSGAPANADPKAEPGPEDNTTTSPTRGMIVIRVPLGAKVYVNDRLTRSTGAERRYASSGLIPGETYRYTVRAEMERDGKVVTETRTVRLSGGARTTLAFSLDAAKSDAIVTTLRLRVPQDARVYLAGQATKAAGVIREFSTSKLPAGQDWTEYPVRVEFERNGQLVVKEETVQLNAGETRDLFFDVDGPRVAANSP